MAGLNEIPVKPSKNPLKVTIIDNNNAYLFALSPDLLNHYAPVLLSAAKTITSGLCYVNDIEAQTFRHVTKWLHHQPYFDCGSFDEKKVEELQKDAIDRLVMRIDTNPVSNMDSNKEEPDFLRAAKYLYAHTPTDHILCKILVDGFCAERFDERETRLSLMTLPKEFLVDVMMRNAHVFNVVDGPLFEMNAHSYHECDNEVVDGKRKMCYSRVT